MSSARCLWIAGFSSVLLWMAQPPLGWWPLAPIALVPWIVLAARRGPNPRYFYRSIWAAAAVYWAVSLQGVRHAHPLMYICWIALAAYLAIYAPLFVAVSRRLGGRGVPLWLAVPVAWTGLECLRNYFLTGVSAAMLGHTMADVPIMIQIADLLGSYGVSFVLASASAAVASWVIWRFDDVPRRPSPWAATAAAVVLIAAALGYGAFRLADAESVPPVSGTSAGGAAARIALIQRNERTEYMQSRDREVEILRRYARQSLDAVRSAEQPIAAVVWPESTFTGDLPWRFSDNDAAVPQQVEMTGPEFQTAIASNQRLFLQRTRDLQRALAAVNAGEKRPHLIAGCGVVHHGKTTSAYSGVVQVTPDGELEDWYGKTHLVMFGEYIPWIGNIPVLRRFVPPGMGIEVGSGPKLFRVGEILLAPSICIETAVERVMVRQFGQLRAAEDGTLPDAVVTVTNDAWFNGTSVVEHHLRCGQLLAVGLRRPILSSANGGPTAWVDRCGRVVERLPNDAHGAVIAQPGPGSGTSLYVRIGDWPARLAAFGCLVAIADLIVASWRQRRAGPEADLGTDDT